MTDHRRLTSGGEAGDQGGVPGGRRADRKPLRQARLGGGCSGRSRRIKTLFRTQKKI